MSKERKARTPLSQGVLSSTQEDFLTNRTTQDTSRIVSSPIIRSPYDSDENKGKPRQTTPTKTKPSTRPKSITELALSDIEHDAIKVHKQRKLPEVSQKVIVVETSTDDMARSGEVETRSFSMPSPARVICHSPSSGRSREGVIKKSQKLDNASDSSSQNDSSELMNEKKNLSQPQARSKISDSGKKKASKTVKSLSFDDQSRKTGKNTSTGTISTKKKAAKVIPSRYKQAAAAAKKEDGKLKSLCLSAIAPHQFANSDSSKKTSRVTSTPFLTSTMYEGQQRQVSDESIFERTTEPALKKPLITKTINPKLKKTTKDSVRKKEGVKDAGASSGEFDQLTLDLQYARLLQMTYLTMKAEQTFNKQEEVCKAQIYELWASNRKLEKEIESLTVEVNKQKLEAAIDHVLNTQMEGLKHLNDKLSKLISRSTRLGDAVVNTTHYLPVDGVTIDKPGQLLSALDESKSLLAQIQAETRRNQAGINELSLTSDVLMKTVKSEITERNKCTELLAACSTLLNQERSLQVQLLQES